MYYGTNSIINTMTFIISLMEFCLKVLFINQLIKRKKEVFYLTTHSTHFVYGYMASDTW